VPFAANRVSAVCVRVGKHQFAVAEAEAVTETVQISVGAWTGTSKISIIKTCIHCLGFIMLFLSAYLRPLFIFIMAASVAIQLFRSSAIAEPKPEVDYKLGYNGYVADAYDVDGSITPAPDKPTPFRITIVCDYKGGKNKIYQNVIVGTDGLFHIMTGWPQGKNCTGNASVLK
jgi:hypothetical protein